MHSFYESAHQARFIQPKLNRVTKTYYDANDNYLFIIRIQAKKNKKTLRRNHRKNPIRDTFCFLLHRRCIVIFLCYLGNMSNSMANLVYIIFAYGSLRPSHLIPFTSIKRNENRVVPARSQEGGRVTDEKGAKESIF